MSTVKLEKVPELHPSETEFIHPIKYLSKPEIIELGNKYGILKIIPPKNWKPNFSLDWNTFKFHTRIQKLHELNLRNRSRACFVEGFNCYLQSKGVDPIPVVEDLCYGVSDSYSLSEEDFMNHLNGWIKLKNNLKVHIHDIFMSKKEIRKWFYRIKEEDNEFLKMLSTYCKILSGMLNLEEADDLITNHHLILQKSLKFPASLLVQPENMKQLQRMKTKMSKVKKKQTNVNKRMKMDSKMNSASKKPLIINLITPPLESLGTFQGGEEKRQGEEEDTKTYDTPLTPDFLTPEKLDETCTICYSSKSPETTLLCDGCSKGYHMKCLPVPLEKVPKYDWFCNECLIGSTSVYSEYGFEEEFENQFSLKEFKKYCDEWEIKVFQLIKKGALNVGFKTSDEELKNNKFTEDNMNRMFWNLTNGVISLPEGEFKNLKIRYGADINSSIPGEVSGFPTVDNPRITTEDSKYFNSEWNLTKLPFAKGSLLEYICHSLGEEIVSGNEVIKKEEQISGMSVPWLYIGGPLSTFCWHKEDHYTLSANYSHLGSPKKWYGIPAKFSNKFEKVINNIAPEYEAKQKDLMHQLVSMLSPNEIKGGIPIYETIQRPGEFIITFPKVYHSGFNYGFNVNEAVNFTLPSWVEYSISAVKEYEKVGKECVFDTFKLLRKIYFDLMNEKGREEWMKDTGIDMHEVKRIMKWVNFEYNLEVEKFVNVYKNEEFNNIMHRIQKIKLNEYLSECKKIAEGCKGLIDEGIEIDDKLCVDCKTRVHFHWVVVDLYEACINQLTDLVENSTKAKEVKGLGISEYKDKESEWHDIINKAKLKEEEIESDNRGVKLRRSSRHLNKRKHEVMEVVANENRDQQELQHSLELLRKENGFFGKNVFCISCFQLEMAGLSTDTKEQVIHASIVVEEGV